MSNNLVIGLGNTGSNIADLASKSSLLHNVTFYSIDSQTSSINQDSISKIKYIPIVSDEKNGSGRDRSRGSAMFTFHESNGAFDELYEDAVNAKSPVVVITSSAGGTGSGSVVPLCQTLIDKGVSVLPIIVCPNPNDPAAMQLNTNDLFMDLGQIGIATYGIFTNRKGDANYLPINTDVVNFIEIIFGKRYDVKSNDDTSRDTIDDSDLDKILEVPGRIMAFTCSANNIQMLARKIAEKAFTGNQPSWNKDSITQTTLVTGFALKSMFADTEFADAFAELNNRIDSKTVYDEYRHIIRDDNQGNCDASVIIAGLPRYEVPIFEANYSEVQGLGDGGKRATRPSFATRKKATIVPGGKDNLSKFNWKKEN